MVRREDFGDQYPSDSDDVTLPDPTSNFRELDYRPSSIERKGTPYEYRRQLVPEQNVEKTYRPKKETYTGTILGPVDKKDRDLREYWVFRDDGGYGIATALDMMDEHDYVPGNTVLLIESRYPGQFFIIGDKDADECACLIFTQGQDLTLNIEKTLVFADQYKVWPIDNTYGYEAIDYFKANDSHTEIHFQKEGMYDITLQVKISSEPLELPVRFYVQSECIDVNTEEPNKFKVPLLQFDKHVGFKVGKLEDCYAGVTIECPKPYMVLNQRKAGDPPVWTDTLELNGGLHLGKSGKPAWLQINNTRIRGAGALSIMLPGNAPSGQNDFLVVDGSDGSCVQLGFHPPGATGNLKVLDCNYNCVVIRVERGLIVAGPELVSSPPAPGAVCPVTYEEIYEPCPPEE